MNDKDWYLYVLECGDGTLYTGITTDVDRRLKQHREGKGAKYTRSRGPLKLLRSWKYVSRSAASVAEYAFKQLPRSEKLIRVARKESE